MTLMLHRLEYDVLMSKLGWFIYFTRCSYPLTLEALLVVVLFPICHCFLAKKERLENLFLPSQYLPCAAYCLSYWFSPTVCLEARYSLEVWSRSAISTEYGFDEVRSWRDTVSRRRAVSTYCLEEERSRRGTVSTGYSLDDDQINIIVDKAATQPVYPSHESSNILLAGVLSP